MNETNERLRPRRLWLTVPLYLVLLVVAVADVWAGVFWTAVGGAIGWAIAAAAGVVVLLIAAFLALDAQRQWRLAHWADDR